MAYKKFHQTITIEQPHLDSYGHVNNAAYLQLFEEARWQVITPRGYGLDIIRKTQQGPVVLEVHLRFIKELRLHQKVTIHTELVSAQGKIQEFLQTMTNEKDELCCEAKFKFGLFDIQQRKLIDPTPAWLAAIGFNETE